MQSSAAVPPPRQKLVRAATRGGTRLRRSRKWWLVPLVAVATVSVALAVGLLVVYPRVGASKIRDKLTDKLTAKLGRDVKMGEIDVSLGHATVRDIEIRGPNDGELPLVYIARVDVDFEALPSLIGRVRLGDAKIDGMVMTVRRHADGRDNIKDVIDRLQAQRGGGGGTESDEPGTMPTSITVTKVKMVADDAKGGATIVINDGNATWKPGELIAQMREVSATTTGAPKASVAKLDIKKLSGSPPTVSVAGGEISLWPRLALSSIAGTVSADLANPGHFNIDLVGGYGGVPNLWTAKGPLDGRTYTASIELEAQKFQLDRLAPILARSPVVDYQNTSIDTKIKLDISPAGGKFDGQFSLRGLNVGHPLLAERDVHDLDLTGKVAGSFDRTSRKFELSRGDFKTRDVAFSVTGSAARPQGAPSETADVKRGPGGIQLLDLRLVIPPVDCQRVLDAIPKEMAPYMAGYKVRGVFDTDVKLAIDWDRLDDVELGGHVGYKHCKITSEPADSAKRLLKEFEHYVEIEKGKWHSFVVGDTNEDFVPFDDISPYLVKSIMSTEDSAFYHHKGFITSEFRTALVNDLKMGGFRYGASSITMQMVKNVLLYRDKTLARKLQELFLTWHVENTLKKDRILEIYFNVIEYGPGLYGIGPAVKHFFGKSPKDLNPVEAAFFSTILPAPKERYKQYCAGTLTKWTKDKIDRILGIMLKRDRLTQAEYDQAMATPLVFVKNDDETEKECLKRTNDIIKKARSTNPLKR